MAENKEFDFSYEMVQGRKHLRILKHDTYQFDFVSLVQEIFQVDDLSLLHTHQQRCYELFTEFGKDNNTEFHDSFYTILRSEKGNKIKELYNKFVREVILPYLGLTEALVQVFPTFRVQLPNNVAVAKMHNDHELGHPIGEINFIIGLTSLFDSNTIWIEKLPTCEDFTKMTIEPNQCISFNGNLCNHYNKVNETGKTRVSMDFRVLPMNYVPKEECNSLSTRQRFADGGYYNKVVLEHQ